MFQFRTISQRNVRYLRNPTKDLSEAILPVKNYWKSIGNQLEAGLVKVEKIELPLIHPRLPYCGIVDCVGYIDGFGWCVIDWKTSQKRKKVIFFFFLFLDVSFKNLGDCFDEPLQIAAYAGALGLNKVLGQNQTFRDFFPDFF
jgi:hypothetical protein